MQIKKILYLMFILLIIIMGLTGCSSLPFTTKNYTLDIDKKGQGSIIEPNGEGEYEFKEDTIVTIKLEPAEGYKFKTWKGSNSSDLVEKKFPNEWEITMDDDKSITAIFDEIVATVSGQISIYNNDKDSSVQSYSANSNKKTNQIEINEYESSSLYEKNEIIIKYKPIISTQSVKGMENNNSLTKMGQMNSKGNIALYKIPEDKTVTQMIDKFKKQKNVEWVSPNYIYKALEVPIDEYYDKQWGHIQMNLESAWDVETGSDSVTVAVIDTGIIPSHEDLKDNLSDEGVDFVGYPNDRETLPEDYVITDDDPTDETSKSEGGSHGTHVTGIIGAVGDNSKGIAGVNWNVNILPVRVLGSDGSGSSWDIAEGIYYSIDEEVDVINLSLGIRLEEGEELEDNLMKNALIEAEQKGIINFAASGNSGTDEVLYPARYDSTVAVGSIDSNYEKSSFSNYGSNLDLVAPGGSDSNGNSIYSTWGYYKTDTTIPWGYFSMSGTSMATPYASGVAALLISNGVTGVDNIKERMTSTAVDLGAKGKDEEYGYGLIDAYGALLNKELGGPYIFAGKETDGTIEVVSEVTQLSGGDYKLNHVEPGNIKIYGWRDSNNNGEIDAGDYWGETNYIDIEGSTSYTRDIDIYYVSESTESNLTVEGMDSF